MLGSSNLFVSHLSKMASSSQLPSDMPTEMEKDGLLVYMNDPHAPFIYDEVNSKKTDPPSIRGGEFIVYTKY